MSPASLPIHCFETFTYDIRPCITQGMKIISGSSWSAWVFLPLSMHLSLPSLMCHHFCASSIKLPYSGLRGLSLSTFQALGQAHHRVHHRRHHHEHRHGDRHERLQGHFRLHRLVCFTAGAAAAFACTLHTRRCVRRVEPGDAER